MKKELSFVIAEGDLTVDLAFHEVSASLLTEFAEPFYRGDVIIAVEVLMLQAIADGEFVLSPFKCVKSEVNG